MFHVLHVIIFYKQYFTRKKVQEIQDQIDGHERLINEELITNKMYDIGTARLNNRQIKPSY